MDSPIQDIILDINHNSKYKIGTIMKITIDKQIKNGINKCMFFHKSNRNILKQKHMHFCTDLANLSHHNIDT